MGKRIICNYGNRSRLLLKALFVLAFVPGIVSSCEKEDTGLSVTIDGLKYYLYHSNKAIIDSNKNNKSWEGELSIPETVEYQGESYIVKGMVCNAFRFCTGLTKVRIPKTIDQIAHRIGGGNGEASPYAMNPFVGCYALESIEVDEDNLFMCSVDGVLFSKDMTRLYAYPAGAKRENYTIPESVTWLGQEVFGYNKHLSSLTFRGTFPDDIRYDTFFCMDTTTVIYVHQSEIEKFKKVYSGKVLPLESLQE